MPWGTWTLAGGDQNTTLRFSTINNATLTAQSIADPIEFPSVAQLTQSPFIYGLLVINEKNQIVDAGSVPPYPALPSWRKPQRLIG